MARPKKELTVEEAAAKLAKMKLNNKLRQRKYYAENTEKAKETQRNFQKRLKAAAPEPAAAKQPEPEPELQQPANKPANKKTVKRSDIRKKPIKVIPRENKNDLTVETVISAMGKSNVLKTEGNRKININNIKTVYKMINNDNLYDYVQDSKQIADVINSTKQQKDKTREYSNNSKVNFIMAVINACKVFDMKEEDGVDFEGLWWYYKYFKTKSMLENNPVKNTKPEEAVISYDKYMDKIKETFNTNSREYLLANLYNDCTLRNDYEGIILVNNIDDCTKEKQNYIVLPQSENKRAKIVLKKYKTFGKHGQKEIKISSYTTGLLRNYVVDKTIKLSSNLFPKSLKSTILKMNKAAGVKGTGVNDIRHSIISTLYDKYKKGENEDEMAKLIMEHVYKTGHEVKTWFEYVRAIKKVD